MQHWGLQYELLGLRANCSVTYNLFVLISQTEKNASYLNSILWGLEKLLVKALHERRGPEIDPQNHTLK